MDRIDQRLLSSLQEDSRRSIAELAEQVALSPSACHRRIKQLEDSGFIQGYGARVDGKKLGYAMEFFIGVSLETQHEEALTRFESSVKEIPEILECFLMNSIKPGATHYQPAHRLCDSTRRCVIKINGNIACDDIA